MSATDQSASKISPRSSKPRFSKRVVRETGGTQPGSQSHKAQPAIIKSRSVATLGTIKPRGSSVSTLVLPSCLALGRRRRGGGRCFGRGGGLSRGLSVPHRLFSGHEFGRLCQPAVFRH